jgi:hypothetical protein
MFSTSVSGFVATMGSKVSGRSGVELELRHRLLEQKKEKKKASHTRTTHRTVIYLDQSCRWSHMCALDWKAWTPLVSRMALLSYVVRMLRSGATFRSLYARLCCKIPWSCV